MPPNESAVLRDQNRNRTRGRALLHGVLSGLAARGLTLLVPLLTLPLTLEYLGTQLFGLWMTALSVTAAVGFADLGLGNGILTKLPHTLIRAPHEARAVVASAYAALSGVALLIATLSVMGSTLTDLSALIGGGEASNNQAEGVVLVCLLSFAMSLPMTLIHRIQVAAQDTWLGNAWQAVGAIGALVFIIGAIQLDVGPVWVVAGGLVAPLMASSLNTVLYFGLLRPHLRPALHLVNAEQFRDLLRLGGKFLALGIMTSVALNIDNILIARIRGVDEVTTFAVAVRAFSVLSLLVTLVALPLWSANADALARRDISWVKTNTRLVTIAVLGSVATGGTVLLLMRDPIFEVWLDGAVFVPIGLAVGLLAWSVALAAASPLFSVQNSIGLLRYQMIGWAAFLAMSIPAKVVAVREMGIQGAPIAGCICYLVTLIPAAVLGYRSALRSHGHCEQPNGYH